MPAEAMNAPELIEAFEAKWKAMEERRTRAKPGNTTEAPAPEPGEVTEEDDEPVRPARRLRTRRGRR